MDGRYQSPSASGCANAGRYLWRIRPSPSLVAFSLAFLAGCLPQGVVSSSASPVPGTVAKASDDDHDLPRREPHPSTCVAFGDFHYQAALDGKRTTIQREALLDTARKAYQQALRDDPKCVEAHRGLARVYERLGDHDRTVAAYTKAIETFPQDASFRFDLGMFLARSKDWERAIANLRAAYELEPENRAYGTNLAYALARAGQYDASLACFQKMVGEAQAHYNLARMLRHLNDNDNCRAQLQLALQADPNLAVARQLLAEVNAPNSPGIGSTPSTARRPQVAMDFEALSDPASPTDDRFFTMPVATKSNKP